MFTVANSVSERYAWQNCLNHNGEDIGIFPEIFLQIGNTVYQSVQSFIPVGQIGIPRTQRRQLELALEDKVEISFYEIKKQVIPKMDIHVFIKKMYGYVSIHEDELKQEMMNKNNPIGNHYYYNNQSLIFKYGETTMRLDIKTDSEGYLGEETEINVFSLSTNFNILSSNLLRRDLFRDDFSFENIGIGGLDGQMVDIFRRALSTRAIKPEIIKKMGIKHVKGILLYGPPGTGKTLVARNIGNLLTDREPKVVNGPEVLNKYVGESERNIRELFAEAEEDYRLNKENAGLHIIIFDEIDAICKKRGRGGVQSGVNDSLVNQLLSKIDGINALDNIFIIAMTNRKDLIDDALIRAGRLELHVPIGLPDIDGREQIFRIHTKKLRDNLIATGIDIGELARITENFSGAEIEAVVKNASSFAIHELLASDMETIEQKDVMVTMDHFLRAIGDIVPAFGNSNKELVKYLPEKFILPNDSYELLYEHLKEEIALDARLRKFLYLGDVGEGKTTMVTQVAYESGIEYTRIVRAIDIIHLDEYRRSQYLLDIFLDAHQCERSLVILDDIEILINYVNLGKNVSLSSKMYQTLITILKTVPIRGNHNIIVTCNYRALYDHLRETFDTYSACIDGIKKCDIDNLNKKYGLQFDLDHPDFRYADYVSMKTLMDHVVQ